MKGKYIITIFLAFFIAILQQTFFVHFQINKAVVNLPLIVFIIFGFFCKEESDFHLFVAFMFAFFLELTSPNYGFYFVGFLIVWLVLKNIIKLISEKNILSFTFASLASITAYQLLLLFFSLFFADLPKSFNWQGLIYNFVFTLLIYCFYVIGWEKIQS